MDSVRRMPFALGLTSLPRIEWPALSAWLLPFILIAYIALKGGGYDVVVRSEVGIAVWWTALLATLIGVLPATRIGRIGWIAFALLVAFVAWTALGIGWSESAERSATELGKVATYLGVFTLALTLQRPELRRHMLNGLAAAVALVATLAVLSRLHPSWFPANQTASFLPNLDTRLNYPLNYWNALAALVSLGLPLLLGLASSARTLLGQALAAASIPVLALSLFFTFSRGGVLAAAVGLTAFFLLMPNRLPKLLSLLIVGSGSAILIVAAAQRPAIEDGLVNGAARQQGGELLAMALVVCAGVALLHTGLGLALRYARRPRWSSMRRRPAIAASIVAALVAVGVMIAVDAPGDLSDRWQSFKNPHLEVAAGQQNRLQRFESSSGNGRYQYWQSALDANATQPLHGIGPGTFEFWWARHATIPGFVRDAHSLYFETLAEVGIVGLLLLGGFFLLVLGCGVVRSLRAPNAERLMFAAATAGCAAFIVSASLEWIWEVAVLPMAFLILASVLVTGGKGDVDRPARTSRMVTRGGIAALSIGALLAVALPMASTASVRNSQAVAAPDRVSPALGDALTAQRIQPYAASPRIQQALVLELAGRLEQAAIAARIATEAEPTNWRIWLVRSRIEAERGHPTASIDAYRKARSLNPRSSIFQQ